MPILPITLQRHPVHLEVRTILTKTDTVEGLVQGFRVKKTFVRQEFPIFFLETRAVVFEANGGRETHSLADGAREEGAASSGRYPGELWD